MDTPLVSVIVPIYNVEQYLDRCIRSIVEQTYENIEIVLVNDGSTDSSPIMGEEWSSRDARIRYYSKENGGLSDARNFGIRKASGSLLSFVDSDDVLDPRCIELLLSALVEGKADISLSANLRRFSSDSELCFKPQSLDHIRTYSQAEFAQEFFRLKGNRALHYSCSKLYKREVLDDDQFPKGLLNEDVEGTFKAIIQANRIAEIDNVVYWYFVNPASITESTFGDNYLNLNEVWRRILSIAEKHAPQYRQAAEYNLMRSDFTILCEIIKRGDSSSDKKYAEVEQDHLRKLRENISNLLRGRMSLNRKILAIIVAYFFSPLRFLCRMAQRR